LLSTNRLSQQASCQTQLQLFPSSSSLEGIGQTAPWLLALVFLADIATIQLHTDKGGGKMLIRYLLPTVLLTSMALAMDSGDAAQTEVLP
jgi:hypothetical protein